MRKTYILLIVCSIIIGFSAKPKETKFWGFFGHRLINKTAVFTLPVDLLPLYKNNIDYITKHSIDPDKRRYASPLEAIRHYIDLDNWGAYPFEEIPRTLPDAFVAYSDIHIIEKESRDTIQSWKGSKSWMNILSEYQRNRITQELAQRTFEIQEEGFIKLPDNWIPQGFDSLSHELIFTEHFSDQGILPFHLSFYQLRLTKAFKDLDWPLVIRLSTELGHYISDAHVPLHTTLNYNGQMTGQDGIHAFWESRIPELFATDQYDFFVGRAKYIEEPDSFFWNIVLDSHLLVEEVLQKEMDVRTTFDKDKQYCFDERGTVTSRMECKAYAKAYQDAMSGMVEKQMRKSIQAVGSMWYTAWVDAGRPDIFDEKNELRIDSTKFLSVDSLYKNKPK